MSFSLIIYDHTSGEPRSVLSTTDRAIIQLVARQLMERLLDKPARKVSSLDQERKSRKKKKQQETPDKGGEA